ncbi:Hypothetical predicted protein [Olea europaea subsp. europaea]|uniref:Uncharacterized protein n=1 Tax=Olea europaea subsp. europaea TaxID=158383 RepID=A0A8S0Q7S4_OLEEU|nr:Hypothetical predicted protein [Olea europaea subsp. europaea]
MEDETTDEQPTAFTSLTEIRGEMAGQKRVRLGSSGNENLNIGTSQNTENHEFERRTQVGVSYKNKLMDAINPMGSEVEDEGQVENDGIIQFKFFLLSLYLKRKKMVEKVELEYVMMGRQGKEQTHMDSVIVLVRDVGGNKEVADLGSDAM